MRYKKQTPEERIRLKEELRQTAPPEMRRRRVRASKAILMAQEGAAQVQNDAWALLREAHFAKAALPSEKLLRQQIKGGPSAIVLGRAKQVQYAIVDAMAVFKSFRSNFFSWVKDPSLYRGMPRPPRFYRRGKRARLHFDYQEFRVAGDMLRFPPSLGLAAVALVDRSGTPLLGPGDKLVEVRVEPCRSRKWVDLDLVIRRAVPYPQSSRPRNGRLLIDLGVARLVTCLDERNLVAFFVSGGIAKSILARGAKWLAALRSEAELGARHGRTKARALAARSARQMEDLMKKVALLVVAYAKDHNLRQVVMGYNKEWKQEIALGRVQNQIFTFIPHRKLIEMIRVKCRRAGIDFLETEESYTSKTDHLARERMEGKPEGYRWLGSRSPRGCFHSSVGVTLQADVNGCIGIGRKVGGEEWLGDFLKRLGASPGTRLVPREVHVNGKPDWAKSQPPRTAHSRADSPRAWISTKVALEKAGLIPASSAVAVATHIPQGFPKAA